MNVAATFCSAPGIAPSNRNKYAVDIAMVAASDGEESIRGRLRKA